MKSVTPDENLPGGAPLSWWEEIYDIMFSEGQIWYPVDELDLATGKEVEFLEDVLDLESGASILDLGCGSGRHCIHLARKGYRTTGVDISEKLLEKARADAQEEGLSPVFTAMDMRAISYSEAFDAVILMDVTFGIFNDEENKSLIESVYRALKPGGVVFFMLYNPYRWASNPSTIHWGGEEGEVIRKYTFDAVEGRVEDAQIFINAKQGIRRVHPVQSIRAYTVPEIRKMCRDTGFTTFSLYGDGGDFIPMMEIKFDPSKSLGLYMKVRK